MLTSARKALLLQRLASDGQLTVSPLAIELGVSEDTLRRDLRDLASAGELVRVHGGALPASPTHLPMTSRRDLHEREKRSLAKASADLVQDGQVIIVDGGTTHMCLAAALPQSRRCTIVTHSPSVAASFEFHDKVDIILIGGRIYRHSMVAMGVETATAYSRIKADLCFLGVTGVHPDHGLSTGDSEEADLKRTMVRAAGETVVLATADKLARASHWGIAPLSQLSALVMCDERPLWLPDTVLHVQAVLPSGPSEEMVGA